jgi:hypothetical protein
MFSPGSPTRFHLVSVGSRERGGDASSAYKINGFLSLNVSAVVRDGMQVRREASQLTVDRWAGITIWSCQAPGSGYGE